MLIIYASIFDRFKLLLLVQKKQQSTEISIFLSTGYVKERVKCKASDHWGLAPVAKQPHSLESVRS